MNEHCVERFSRRNRPPSEYPTQPGRQPGPKLELNIRIRGYVNSDPRQANAPSYVYVREIPTTAEISVAESDEAFEIPANQVVGPWESKKKYLSDHYALLREDAVTPLRNVVSELKAEPHILEKESMEHAYIYEKVPGIFPFCVTEFLMRRQVFIIGLTFAHDGVAAKMTFSLRRSGKKIIWEQSKRLRQGTLVALTPVHDVFNTICKVGIVAARPLTGVQSNPPEVDIFFGSPDELEIDPQQEWIMAESSEGYFEAYRHTLASLQHLAMEPYDPTLRPYCVLNVLQIPSC